MEAAAKRPSKAQEAEHDEEDVDPSVSLRFSAHLCMRLL